MQRRIGHGARQWVLATLPAACLIAVAPQPAQSRTGQLEPVAGATAQAPQTYDFDIASEPLPQAIAAFSEVTGLQVLYTERSAFDHRAPAIRGSYSAREALDLLLAGSGLAGRFTDSGTVTIARSADETGGGPVTLKPIQIYGAKNAAALDDSLSSVAVVTSEEIEQRQLGSFREAFRMMANVMDADWKDAGFVIRGINSEGLTPGGDPLASLYIDGVQQTVQGARRGARGLWDVEQVEVYRGPQSTLSGRAALAGAVYIKTKDPTFEWEGAAQATAGTMETRGGAFMVNGPVGDQVAFRIAAEYERSENDINYPDYTSFDRYDDFVEDEYYQVRGKVLVLPEALPDTSTLLTYSFAHDSPYIDDIGGPVLGFDYGERRGDFNLPVFAEARTADNDNAALEIGHDLTPSLRLTSLTTYAGTDVDRSSVNEGTAGETNYTDGSMEQYVATQEFRGNYAAGPWSSVLGVYFASEKSDAEFRRPDYFGRSDVSDSGEDVFNAAAFGEVTYEFVPTWSVVAGGRLDHTDKTNSSFFSRNGVTTVDQETSTNETVLLPKFGLIKEITPDHTVGLSAQKGFRSGGADVQRSSGETYNFDPEFAWTYEVSYKGSFLDGRLQTGANLFYMDWSDQQVEVQDDPADFTSTRITNAASSTSTGFEVEGRYQVTDGLSSFLSIGYLNTKFDDFEDASLGDLSGLQFPEAPKWSLAFGGHYRHSSGFFIGADAKYLSEYLGRLDSAPFEYVDGYWVANAQAGYEHGPLRVTVFAENLFDNDYFVYNARDDSCEDIAATLGPRQVIGLTASIRF